MKTGYFTKILCLVVLIAGLCGLEEHCQAAQPLKVGITPDYPPLVFREPDGTNGLEIDLAKSLGQELGRPVQFVVLNRERQIPALLDHETDIIMSGMSITRSRQLRIAFSAPYLQSQIRAIFLRKNAARFASVDQVLNTRARIGVVAGTTGEILAKQDCPNAVIDPITKRRDIGFYLIKGNRFDLFIDDVFALAAVYSKNEAALAFLAQPLKQEDLAWGIRPADKEFLKQVNDILARRKANGTLEKAIDKWIPYLKVMRSNAPATQANAAH